MSARGRELFGEFLVRKGYISQEELDEAISAQFVFGGRLGTNLLDMGIITERELAKALAEYHKVPPVRLEDLRKLDRSMLGALDRQTVEKTGVIPLRSSGREVIAIVLDPGDLKALEEAEFKLGKRIKPLVVPEVTFRLLLEKLYGIRRDPRFVTLTMRETREAYQKRRRRGLELVEERKEEVEEELPEIEVPEDIKARWAMEEAIQEQREEVEEEKEEGESLEEPKEEEKEEEILLLEEVEEEIEPAEEEIELTESLDEAIPVLSRGEADALLKSASSRDEIARGVLGFASNFFERVAIFTVRKGFIMGWDAAAPDEVRQRLRTAIFTVDERSTFGFVVRSRAHYIGPLFPSPVDEMFINILGGDPPKSAFLIPVIFRGKVVNVLYGDGGPDRFTPTDVSELIIFLQKLNEIYEAAIENKKSRFYSNR